MAREAAKALAALSADEARGADGLKVIREALSSGAPELIVSAAKLVAKHRLPGLDAALGESYRALKRDPGCLAREALLVAMEAVESNGAALEDANAGVRLAGARAVAHSQLRDGAGLLLLRLGAGDPEPEVAMECLRGLFVIAPDHAVRRARELLGSDSEHLREQTLHALGTAPDDRAIELLAEDLREQSISHERSLVIESCRRWPFIATTQGWWTASAKP